MGSFEELLDASWCSFRGKLLEAYERSCVPEQEVSIESARSTVREPFCHPSLDTPKLLSIRPVLPLDEEQETIALVQALASNEEPQKEESSSLLDDVPRRLSECYGPVEDEVPKKLTPTENQRKKSKSAEPRSSRKSRPSRRSSLQVTPLASQRVRMRLGSSAYAEVLTAESLCNALAELGLNFAQEDMEVLVNQLADYIDLKFVKDPEQDQSSGMDVERDQAVWEFPEVKNPSARRSWAMDFKPKRDWNVCPTDALVSLLTDPEVQLSKRIFGPKTWKQFDSIREHLQRWDPNDLVHEITQAKAANLDISEGSNTWGLDMLSSTEAQAIRQRLRVRLGAAVTSERLVSGRALHSAMEALGLTSYTVENMNDLVNSIADFIDLHFEVKPTGGDFRRSNSPMAVFNFEFGEDETTGFGPPLWAWPERNVTSGNVSQAQSVSVSPAAFESRMSYEGNPQRNYNVVPLPALMDLFMIPDYEVHRKMFSSRLLTQFEAMREILLAGDTNRLVAELTFVRINDLAAPPERMGVLLFLEPFVASLIIANGIMIGFQTHPDFENWDGWPWLEVMFVIALVLENVLRIRLLGLRMFFCGNDRIFNWFDFFLSLTGLADLLISHLSEESDMFGVSLLRFCRLIRLVRVVKVFRLRCMKELRLMVKGLVAGFRTLCLSFVLLIAVLYVISGFATMTIGSDQRTSDLGLLIHFETIPQAMFTAFLCFSGECIDRSGRPIHTLIANEFGIPFVMCYVVSYMLVSMGIFNVILAVYVDITMKAAKENDAMTAEQHARESIRIARTTRELLKKFAAAYRLYQDMDNIDKMPQLDFNNGAAPFTDNDIHAQIAITKELFLLVIQDRCVQRLMDELDLPPDRANLFEAIDADGSGTLHVTELVQGLLQIRGEVKKSDAVATLLSTKALQNMVAEMREEMNASFEHMQDFVKAEVQQSIDHLSTQPKSLKRLSAVE